MISNYLLIKYNVCSRNILILGYFAVFVDNYIPGNIVECDVTYALHIYYEMIICVSQTWKTKIYTLNTYDFF